MTIKWVDNTQGFITIIAGFRGFPDRMKIQISLTPVHIENILNIPDFLPILS